MRTIIINPALNGYIVHVGCTTMVFDSRSDLIGQLGRYLENPEAVEKEFTQNAVNKLCVPEPAQERNRVDSPMTATEQIGGSLRR